MRYNTKDGTYLPDVNELKLEASSVRVGSVKFDITKIIDKPKQVFELVMEPETANHSTGSVDEVLFKGDTDRFNGAKIDFSIKVTSPESQESASRLSVTSRIAGGGSAVSPMDQRL